MAANLLQHSDCADDDYIDMEVSDCSNFFSLSRNSPPQPIDFEFHMSSVSLEKEPTTSPADELFYKGKLLPLHLPPRLQMVEKLLEQHSSSSYLDIRKDSSSFEEFYGTPLLSTGANTPTATSTPFESCNISPSESCRLSRELNPEEYLLDYSTEINNFIGQNPKKSWTKKLKLIKQSGLGSKLKASRLYIKALFGKSGCSDDSSAAAKVADEATVSKAKESLNKQATIMKEAKKKAPFGQTQKEKSYSNREKVNEDESNRLHRRSFSMAIKRNSTKNSSFSSSSSSASSSSSNSSSDSKGFQYGISFLKRSNSVICSEIENPIQGAIAHCKQSHNQE